MWEPGLGGSPSTGPHLCLAWGPCMATGVSSMDSTLVLVSQAWSWGGPKAPPVQVASPTRGGPRKMGRL